MHAPPRTRSGSAVVKRQRTVGTPKGRHVSTFRIPRSVGATRTGFPKQLSIKHRLVQSITLSTGATTGVVQFSVNGLFTPSICATHQPMYFDQLAALYNNYTVMNSKITVDFCSPPTGATGGFVAGVYIEDDSTITPSTGFAAAEQPSSVYTILNNPLNYVKTRVAKKWVAKEAYGGDIRDNDDLAGSASANPANEQFFTVFVGNFSGVATISGLLALVTIEYDTVWDKLKNLASS